MYEYVIYSKSCHLICSWSVPDQCTMRRLSSSVAQYTKWKSSKLLFDNVFCSDQLGCLVQLLEVLERKYKKVKNLNLISETLALSLNVPLSLHPPTASPRIFYLTEICKKSKSTAYIHYETDDMALSLNVSLSPLPPTHRAASGQSAATPTSPSPKSYIVHYITVY